MSPAFHIPGREAIDNERDIVSSWTQDMAHLIDEDSFNSNEYAKDPVDAANNPEKKVIRVFEVCDTAVRTGAVNVTFGYYENKTTYPVTEDCDNVPI